MNIIATLWSWSEWLSINVVTSVINLALTFFFSKWWIFPLALKPCLSKVLSIVSKFDDQSTDCAFNDESLRGWVYGGEDESFAAKRIVRLSRKRCCDISGHLLASYRNDSIDANKRWEEMCYLAIILSGFGACPPLCYSWNFFSGHLHILNNWCCKVRHD